MPFFSPVGGGGIGKATASGSSGATVDTSSRAGKTIYKFTGSGSVTIATPGYVEMLVIAGGGSGAYGSASDYSYGSGGGGAGGLVYSASAFVPAGTHSIVIGAGGSSTQVGSIPRTGSNSYFGVAPVVYAALGGGNGAPGAIIAQGRYTGADGGSGGGTGAGQNEFSGGNALLSQGLWGGNGPPGGQGAGGGGAGESPYYGGGGEFGGQQQDAVGRGCPGRQLSITGTATYYAGGGGGSRDNNGPGGTGGVGGGGAGSVNSSTNGTAGTANTGGGGGAGNSAGGANRLGGAGGSGYVVVVIG